MPNKNCMYAARQGMMIYSNNTMYITIMHTTIICVTCKEGLHILIVDIK